MPVMNNDTRKIAIIGAGQVGAATAFALLISGLPTELVLVDINRQRAEGEAMDLAHGVSFVGPVRVYAGNYRDCHDADIIIFTAGVNQRPGQTRLDLTQQNFAVVKEVIPQIIGSGSSSILLMVTNPVDILTYAALRLSELPPSRVIGSGTVLDSSRFRYLLSSLCGVEPRNIHAYVVGEHGDTEVPLWSRANVAGIPVEEFCYRYNLPRLNKEEITRQVKQAAYEVIARKGATNYAIALAVRRICESILRNENSVLTVSSLLNGEYGLTNVCLSLPTIINRSGRMRILPVEMNEEEMAAFRHSATVLQEIQRQLALP